MEQVFIQAKMYYMEYNYIFKEANMYDAQVETKLQEDVKWSRNITPNSWTSMLTERCTKFHDLCALATFVYVSFILYMDENLIKSILFHPYKQLVISISH
jgi:hypothetical protein